MSDNIELLTVNSDHNPILKEDGLPHILKLMVIEEGKWLMQHDYINKIKPFQILVINTWKNNLEYGTDELNDYFNICKIPYAKTEYLDSLKGYLKNMRDGKLIYGYEEKETLTRYRATIEGYCDYLKKNNSSGSIGKLEKFKINSILEKLGEKIDGENIMNKLEIIDKHVTDFVSIKNE
jgi:hypothetical protein